MYQITEGRALAGALTVQKDLAGQSLDVLDATFTIGAEAANAITVAIQLLDGNGREITWRAAVDFYLSDDANGDSITATGPGVSITADPDGVYQPFIAVKAGRLISEADGDIDFKIGETGGATWYLVLILPGGKLKVSGAITFA